MAATEFSPAMTSYQPVVWNFKLLAHDMLGGFGGMGEGMSVQIAPDGRRIIWLAHESAPKNFTAVDVSDPRKPKVVVPDRPAARQHALELARDLRQHHGGGLSDLEEGPAARPASNCSTFPSRRIRTRSAFFDCSGPHSRGVHQLWFCDGEYVHCASGSRDFTPTQPAATTSSTAASTCAIRRSRSKSAAGGCRARGRATTSCRRRAIRSTRAIAPTTPTSIRSGRTAATSPISTAACSCSTFPTRRTRRRSRTGPTRRPIPASCTPSCRCSIAA